MFCPYQYMKLIQVQIEKSTIKQNSTSVAMHCYLEMMNYI